MCSSAVSPRVSFLTKSQRSLLVAALMALGPVANRWQEIYEANREILQGENALRPGQRLKIP